MPLSWLRSSPEVASLQLLLYQGLTMPVAELSWMISEQEKSFFSLPWTN
jgi:hypothetical protein